MRLLFLFTTIGVSTAYADIEKGQSLYRANCSACHGENLDGNGPAGAALQPKPVSFKDAGFWADRNASSVKAGIKNGKPGTAMMPFAHLPDADVEAIVAYLIANKPQ